MWMNFFGISYELVFALYRENADSCWLVLPSEKPSVCCEDNRLEMRVGRTAAA